MHSNRNQSLKGLSRSSLLEYTQRGNRFATFFGDSISAQGFGGTDSTGRIFASVGYATWAAFLSRQRIILTPDSNQGVSGETTTQILNRLTTVVDLEPGVCVVLAGTNDIAAIPVATTISNLDTIYDTLYASGIYTIAIPILPRGDLTSAQYGKIHQVNQWIRAQRLLRRNFAVADCELAFIDLATGVPKATMVNNVVDEIHPIVYGAWAVGNAVAQILNEIYPDPLLPFINRLDIYHATENPGGNLLAGSVGLTEGTTGTKSNGPTGNLATSWSANGVNLPVGVTVAFDKVVKADGREFQQVTFGGTYNNASPSSFNVTAPSVHASCAAGDTIEYVAELEMDAGSSNLAGAQLLLDVATPSGNPSPGDLAANNTNLMPPVAISGVSKTARVILPATPTLVRPTIRFYFKGVTGSSALSAVVRWGSVSARKVLY